MNNKDMESICIIAEEGNITRAAKRLFIAQSSLSQCIQRVEQEFGVTLFIRTKTGIELTDAGHIFIDTAEKAGKLFRDLENSFADLNQLMFGHLIVGIPALLSSYLLPEYLIQFCQRYPNIELETLEADNNRLELLLQRGKIDLAISSNEATDSFDQTPILASDMIVVAPEWFKPGDAVDPVTGILDLRALEGQPFIMYQKKQKLYEITEKILGKANVHVRTVLYTSSSKGGILYSVNGLGFSLQPEISYLFHKPLLNGKGKIYRIANEYTEPWRIIVKQSKNGYYSRASQAFTKELQEFYADYPFSGPIHR